MTKPNLLFLKEKQLYIALIRYALGLCMLPYALSKIFRIQFALTGFDWTLMQNLESIPSKHIAWIFLGYSGWFQVFLGFMELIPALLLLFKRTSLLGAIAMFPITLNVMLINYALNLWDGTKLISVILLSLNLLLLLVEWPKLKPLFFKLIDKNFSNKSQVKEVVINLILISGIGYFILQHLLEIKNQTNPLTGDWINQHPIEWVLEREELKDSILAPRDLRLYFWRSGNYVEAGDIQEEGPISYTIDQVGGQLSFKYDDGSVIKRKFTLLDDTGLKIEATGDRSNLTQYYSKRIININKN